MFRVTVYMKLIHMCTLGGVLHYLRGGGGGKLEGRPCCIKSNSVVVHSVSIVL